MLVLPMDIKAALLKEHSKKQTSSLVSYIGNNKERFAILIEVLFANEPVLAQRAAWVMRYCAETNPTLIKKYVPRLIKNLSTLNLHDAIKRNTLRCFMFTKVPESILGMLADYCFKIVYNDSEAIAIRVYAIYNLLEICHLYKELGEELIPLLQLLKDDESPAMRLCAKKGIAQLIPKEKVLPRQKR